MTAGERVQSWAATKERPKAAWLVVWTAEWMAEQMVPLKQKSKCSEVFEGLVNMGRTSLTSSHVGKKSYLPLRASCSK